MANLAAYTSTIASLTPANLASFGITSSHLSQLAQISSITGGNQSQMAAQATKQAQFEQDVFRSYVGGKKLMFFLVNLHWIFSSLAPRKTYRGETVQVIGFLEE